MTFIFLSLLELAIVGWAEKRVAQEERKRKAQKSILEKKRFSLANFSLRKRKQPPSRSCEIDDISPIYNRPCTLITEDYGSCQSNGVLENRKWRCSSTSSETNSPGRSLLPANSKPLKEFNGVKIDNICARLCPMSFFLFCLAYWGYYVYQSSYQPEFL
jgi:hypothetical protein